MVFSNNDARVSLKGSFKRHMYVVLGNLHLYILVSAYKLPIIINYILIDAMDWSILKAILLDIVGYNGA